MPSVTRDKRNYGVTIGGTSGAEKRRQKEREMVRGEELQREHQKRGYGNEYYFSGRVRPLIEEE